MTRLQSCMLLLVALFCVNCDGTAIVFPQDNTRLTWGELEINSPQPYSIQVLLDATEHAWVTDPSNAWYSLYRLEGYSSLHGAWSEALTLQPQFTGITVELPTGTSYWWRFEIDLYDLGLYNEPNTWGPSFMFRLFLKDDDSQWHPVPGLTVSIAECSKLLNAGNGICPHTYEIRLRAPTYVPNVTLGKTDCQYGDASCSKCVSSLLDQLGVFGVNPFSDVEPLNITSSTDKFQFQDPVDGAFGAGNHVQGIGKLSDAVVDGATLGRMVLTANPNDNPPRGLWVGFKSSEGTDTLFDTDQGYSMNQSFRVMGVEEYGNHTHPGGLQAHGDTVVVAMEGEDVRPCSSSLCGGDELHYSYSYTRHYTDSHGEPLENFLNSGVDCKVVSNSIECLFGTLKYNTLDEEGACEYRNGGWYGGYNCNLNEARAGAGPRLTDWINCINSNCIEKLSPAVYFLEVDGNNIEFLHSFLLDGSQGEPFQGLGGGAATAGFVKLENGYFLMAVSGRKHGTEGIWFYQSSSTTINSTTSWNYLDFYSPAQLCYGSPYDDCYIGAGGGLNLVTDCSGDVYLLAMTGTDPILFRREYEYLQVFRVDQDSNNGQIQLTKVAQQRDDLQLSIIDDEAFRWSGGSYVASDGTLAIMNTERRTNEGNNSTVDGHLYYRD